MSGAIAGFLLPVLAAVVLARRVSPAGAARLALVIPLTGIAVGLASTIGFTLLASGMHARWWFVAADAAIWLAIAGLALRIRPSFASPVPRVPDAGAAARDRLLASAAGLLAIGTVAIAVVWFVATSSVYPHGEWDAWAQWNLRARFFFRGFADGTWRNAFAPVLAWSHPDYPMLVPMSVARLWLYAGAEGVGAPIALAGFLAVATVLTASLATARTRGPARGWLAAAVLLACPSFVRYSAAQCADIAIAFFLLCAFVLWARGTDDPDNPWCWMLAGTAAALAGWTKNEGLAGFGIFTVLAGFERWWTSRSLRPAALLIAGAAPVLLVIVAFKLTLAPPSYFTAEQSLTQAAAHLLDSGRIRVVATAFARELWVTGATTVGIVPFLAVFAAIRGTETHAPATARAAIGAMALLLVVYAAAYAVTPKDLVWQLQTSLDRLVLHVVPTLTWATLTLCR